MFDRDSSCSQQAVRHAVRTLHTGKKMKPTPEFIDNDIDIDIFGFIVNDTLANATMPATATAGQAFLGPGPPSVTRQTYRLAPSLVLHLTVDR
eukprot:COSAG02_NODE_24294_length_692_cov_1.617201_2_plen_93_part_00